MGIGSDQPYFYTVTDNSMYGFLHIGFYLSI